MQPDSKRSDARRNRERVIVAARKAFGTDGLDVSMAVIAKRAGVGVGTLYRHFPTKQALFTAIVEERLIATTERAKKAAAAANPGAAFFALLGSLWAEGFQKKNLVDALTAAGADLRALSQRTAADLHVALGQVLKRAQAASAVRKGITVPDLLGLLSGALTAANRPGASPQRVFDVICDGLAGSARRPR